MHMIQTQEAFKNYR